MYLRGLANDVHHIRFNQRLGRDKRHIWETQLHQASQLLFDRLWDIRQNFDLHCIGWMEQVPHRRIGIRTQLFHGARQAFESSLDGFQQPLL